MGAQCLAVLKQKSLNQFEFPNVKWGKSPTNSMVSKIFTKQNFENSDTVFHPNPSKFIFFQSTGRVPDYFVRHIGEMAG